MRVGEEKNTTDRWHSMNKGKNGKDRITHSEVLRKCVSIAWNLKYEEGIIADNKDKITTGFIWLAQRCTLPKSWTS